MKWPQQKGGLPFGHMLVYGFLPGPLKVLLYRLRGYRIGKSVKIGLGSIVMGEDVRIGDHTTIGFFDIIRGRRIDIGDHVSIGSASFIQTSDIELGDGAVLTEQVFIGGQQEMEGSRFKLGKNAIVMYLTFINTFRPVTIGDDSGIGGHCIIFSHGTWPSKFEGYPDTFEPVEIGNRVWLPWRVFVMPGAKIGDGSVIGANSLVDGEIPPHSLAVGSPAKVIRSDYPTTPSPETKAMIFDELVDELVGHFRFHRFVVRRNGCVIKVTKTEPRRLFGMKQIHGCLYVARDRDALGRLSASLANDPIQLVLSLPKIDPELRRSLTSDSIMWMEIDRKERSEGSDDPFCREIAHVVGRWGVRFTYVKPPGSECNSRLPAELVKPGAGR